MTAKKAVSYGTLVAAILVVFSGAGSAPEPSNQVVGNAAVRSFVQPFTESAMFDGVVKIERGGEVVLDDSFGLASYELRVQNTPQTRFRIASLSKDITDAAIGILIQNGEISLETTLSEYFPDYAHADQINIGQLQGHRSGIPHTNSQAWGEAIPPISLDEIVDRLLALPLDFEPGQSRGYSNGGYALLARIIEIEGGAPFGEVIDDLIFTPLGMNDSGHISDWRAVIDGVAVGYEPGPVVGERRRSRPYPPEMRPGGGSFFSTSTDLLRFYRALLDGDLLEEPVRHEIFGDFNTPYEATGRSPGFSGQIYIDPEQDAIVVMLLNSYIHSEGLPKALLDLVQGEPISPTWHQAFENVETAMLDDPRVGWYEWPSFIGATGEVTHGRDNNLLYTDHENNYSTALVPLEHGGFLFPMYYLNCLPEDTGTRSFNCVPLNGNVDRSLSLTRIPAPLQ